MLKNSLAFCVLSLILFNIPFSYSQNNSCKSCTLKPGDLIHFKSALKDAKLHYYTNQGKTKLDLKKAEEVCDLNYFFECNDKMVLISPGQKSDRIEIRQDKDLALDKKSTLYFLASFEDVPTDRLNKGVTIAQIHNDTKGVKRPLLRVEITGNNQIRVILTESYLKNEGIVENDFFIPFNEKDLIECTLTILGNEEDILIKLKNVTQNKKREIVYHVSDLWKTMDGNFYFKSGAYTQVSGAKTKVTYHKFKFFYQ